MLHSLLWLNLIAHSVVVSYCDFIGVTNSFADPGKDKELKSPAASKNKGNMARRIFI